MSTVITILITDIFLGAFAFMLGSPHVRKESTTYCFLILAIVMCIYLGCRAAW